MKLISDMLFLDPSISSLSISWNKRGENLSVRLTLINLNKQSIHTGTHPYKACGFSMFFCTVCGAPFAQAFHAEEWQQMQKKLTKKKGEKTLAVYRASYQCFEWKSFPLNHSAYATGIALQAFVEIAQTRDNNTLVSLFFLLFSFLFSLYPSEPTLSPPPQPLTPCFSNFCSFFWKCGSKNDINAPIESCRKTVLYVEELQSIHWIPLHVYPRTDHSKCWFIIKFVFLQVIMELLFTHEWKWLIESDLL